jgi:CopG antitoxin of type II toxin-antitoxin system
MVANKNNKNIPGSFESIEQAGAFWDTHSLADFEKQTKPVGFTFDITKRTRYITVPETVYKKISIKAKTKRVSIRNLVCSLGK